MSEQLNVNGTKINPITDYASVNCGTMTLQEKLENEDLLNTLVKPINKYFVVIMDDLERSVFDSLEWFKSVGIKPCFALRSDYIPSKITWEEVKEIYDLGFEIAYHGTYHSGSWNDELMNVDIPTWLEEFESHGMKTVGYVGPNGYGLPNESEKYFLWARPSKRGNNLDYFAGVGTTWLDTITDTSSIIALADNLQDNQYIVLSWHFEKFETNKEALKTIINGLKAKGLTPLAPKEAVMQSTIKFGSLGTNTTFMLASGTATGNYFAVAGNGKVRSNQE